VLLAEEYLRLPESKKKLLVERNLILDYINTNNKYVTQNKNK